MTCHSQNTTTYAPSLHTGVGFDREPRRVPGFSIFDHIPVLPGSILAGKTTINTHIRNL